MSDVGEHLMVYAKALEPALVILIKMAERIFFDKLHIFNKFI